MAKISFSLNKLISNLLEIKHEDEFAIPPGEETKGTTIRLGPEVKRFCDVQAEKLGVSAQAFISMIIKGVMMETLAPVKTELTLMQERFFEVFKIHKIPVTDIPLFLKEFNITLSTISDGGRLLDAYSPKIIDYIAERFYINTEWLRGSVHTYCSHSYIKYWYKYSYQLCLDLAAKLKSGEYPELVLIKNTDYLLDSFHESDEKAWDLSLIKVIQKGQRFYDEGRKSFTYFKHYNQDAWHYEKCRLELKSIILFCYIMRIPVRGLSASCNIFQEICRDKEPFSNYMSALDKTNYNWNPLDFVVSPDNEKNAPINHQNELDEVFKTFFNKKLPDIIIKQSTSYRADYLDKISSIDFA